MILLAGLFSLMARGSKGLVTSSTPLVVRARCEAQRLETPPTLDEEGGAGRMTTSCFTPESFPIRTALASMSRRYGACDKRTKYEFVKMTFERIEGAD